jgi:glycosyltransferase involved in cell wall biosynthesis
MTPIVSVIIPTYNSARWIRDTLASVSAQTYPAVEAVVIDDGSQDDTLEICRSRGGNITIVSQTNQGRGAARRQGLHTARGELLAFLDHDDLLLANSIEERVRFLQANPRIDWLFTDAVEFDAECDLRLYLDQFPWLDLGRDSFTQLLLGCFPLMSTVMIRRSLVDRIGGFDPRYKYGDDIEYFMRLLLVSQVGMIRKPLTRRRIHPDQGVSSTFDRWHSRIGIYTDFLSAGHGLTSSQQAEVREALKHAHYKLGEWYWGEYQKGDARFHFLRSLGKNWWSFRAVLYAILTYAPRPGLRFVRELKAILLRARLFTFWS